MSVNVPKCSCISCQKEVSSKGIHTHYLGAHTEKGRLVRSQCGRLAAVRPVIPRPAFEAYNQKPIKCKQCNSIIPFSKRFNQFCSQTCSGRYNNTLRPAGHPSRTKSNESRKNKLAVSKVVKKEKKLKEVYLFTPISTCIICYKWFTFSTKHTPKTCSKTCLSKRLSNSAKETIKTGKMGGNKNNNAYGWYDSPSAGRVWLESSYEYRVAVDLDAHGVKWIRPPYLPYNSKKYYADFYLIDYNIYLDPKNDYLITMDKEKIDIVMDENSVVVLILNKNQLSWKDIKCLIKSLAPTQARTGV